MRASDLLEEHALGVWHVRQHESAAHPGHVSQSSQYAITSSRAAYTPACADVASLRLKLQMLMLALSAPLALTLLSAHSDELLRTLELFMCSHVPLAMAGLAFGQSLPLFYHYAPID